MRLVCYIYLHYFAVWCVGKGIDVLTMEYIEMKRLMSKQATQLHILRSQLNAGKLDTIEFSLFH